MRMKYIVKKSLTDTLATLPLNSPQIIKTKDFKVSAARSAKYRLKRKGIIIDITEDGMIDEYQVMRVK